MAKDENMLNPTNIADSYWLGVAEGEAQKATQLAQEWKTYAKSVEANLAGSEAVKQAALQELAKLDPKSYLLIQQNRQKIFDAAYDAMLAGQ
ncbi:hypothetical protein [Candidatus Glomeribacter gigasporarum]|nr:hypothetical protein [Candidatus Glomeribacter gigasporarum]